MINRNNLLALRDALNVVLGEMEKPTPKKRLTKKQQHFERFEKMYGALQKKKTLKT